MVSVAFGTTAPEGSTTVPETPPLVTTCATVAAGNRSIATTSPKHSAKPHPIEKRRKDWYLIECLRQVSSRKGRNRHTTVCIQATLHRPTRSTTLHTPSMRGSVCIQYKMSRYILASTTPPSFIFPVLALARQANNHCHSTDPLQYQRPAR